MAGEWLGVHRPPEKHKCDKPAGQGHDEFNVWRCSCGKAYRWEYGGSQYNEDWYHWARFPSMDQLTPRGGS